jgi:hypothetical protein
MRILPKASTRTGAERTDLLQCEGVLTVYATIRTSLNYCHTEKPKPRTVTMMVREGISRRTSSNC